MPYGLTPEQQVQRLRSQIGWITRLSAALSSTSNIEDVVSLVLCGVVSPACLGYSQVLLFEYDHAQHMLKGRYALAHDSKEEFEALASEMEEESSFVREQTESRDQIRAAGADKEDLDWLAESTQWVTISQRLNVDNTLTDRIRTLSIPTRRPPSSDGSKAPAFKELEEWRGPVAMKKSKLEDRLPPRLVKLLPEHFAVIPLFKQDGLWGVMIVDRRLRGDVPFATEELSELDWFSRQATLSLENMAIAEDLKTTYEDLKQLDELKTNFLSVISHELRTPLTAMSGFVDLILDERVGPVNENQRTLLKRVQKNTHHLSHLVNDLIEVAQIQAEGTVEVSLEAVEPLAVLMNTIPKLEERRRETKVHVEPVIECDVPMIITDERALGRILFHLLDNALKFSAEGGKVEVTMTPSEDELSIAVIDKGVGVSPKNLKRIFDMFYQADNTLTRGFEGLGLGLAVTKILIQATRGRILVESEEGKGSTFTVVYPLAR